MNDDDRATQAEELISRNEGGARVHLSRVGTGSPTDPDLH